MNICLRTTSLTAFNLSRNSRLLKPGHPPALNYAHTMTCKPITS